MLTRNCTSLLLSTLSNINQHTKHNNTYNHIFTPSQIFLISPVMAFKWLGIRTFSVINFENLYIFIRLEFGIHNITFSILILKYH